jgi:hypothetical protein
MSEWRALEFGDKTSFCENWRQAIQRLKEGIMTRAATQFGIPCLILVCGALGWSQERLPREQWGASLVQVSQAANQWKITGRRQSVSLDVSDLAVEIRSGPALWRLLPSTAGDLQVRSGGKDYSVRLADAGKIAISPIDAGFKTGVKIALSGWRTATNQTSRGLMLYLAICLEGNNEELVFDIAADEGETTVRRLDWPAPLDSRDFDHTVLSNIRGVLLPRNWPRPYHPIRATNPDGSIKNDDVSEVQSNVIESWSMSWWGFQKSSAATMIMVETPDDAAYSFEHPAGGPTVIGPRWRPALGKLGYMRTARMCFFPKGNYVDLAKRYRRYAIETGLFVSLKEKIARQATVTELIGTPLMRAGILTNIKPGSARFKRTKRPEDNYRLVTFDQRAEFLRKLKSIGLDRLTVVLTGWPRLGYDRQHPDVLPPAPEAGGAEGMKRLAEACRALGYLFSLHDQYRDFYIDAPTYDPQFAVHEEDATGPPAAFPGTRFGHWKEGRIPFMDYWEGGKMTYLNGRFMLGHLVKNYNWLFERGIRPQGSYLDVFGYVPPDEDFNPEHPTTRSECLRERARCYTWVRANLGFTGTEAACDWTVPYADISSPLRPKGGIPVPLFNLVYHDAIITTYAPDDLHGFLNAGLPQIGAREPEAVELEQIRRMAALQMRLAFVELTGHEFLDGNYRKERTRYADGTTVMVDWDTKTVTIEPENGPLKK